MWKTSWMVKLYALMTNNPCTHWETGKGGYLFGRGGVEVTRGPSTFDTSVGTAGVLIYTVKIGERFSCVLLQK